MRELLIFRHGKSGWPAGVADFDRPLKKRGEDAATRIGFWLRDSKLAPELVLSSPAARAIATARLTCDAMGLERDRIHEDKNLYLAGLEKLLAIVRAIPPSTNRAMIVGHNPGLEELLATVAETTISPYDDNGRMPTAALAVMRLPCAWEDIATGAASLVTMIRPRELPPAD
jgi:phosphohistidine phosphatase